MCLNPIKIPSKSVFYTFDRLQKKTTTVPCGECAECMQNKQNEYYLRSYYQCIDCWDKGGYILFDTLTYNDQHLPYLSKFYKDFGIDNLNIPGKFDYSCFHYPDIRQFLVNLRRQIEYNGYDAKQLKYFIVSEYGSHDEYVTKKGVIRKGTNRPHYHVLFYVYDKNLDPMTLSELISKTWKYGRTDGYPYKQRTYVMNHVFTGHHNELHARAVCNYVAGYLCKDMEENKILKNRFESIFDYVSDIWFNKNMKLYFGIDYNIEKKDIRKLILYGDKKAKDLFNELTKGIDNVDFEKLYTFLNYSRKELRQLRLAFKRLVIPFTRQSQGFGVYMIEKLTPEFIKENNVIRIPDKERIFKYLPIPNYIKTKMFREKTIDEFGMEYYKWTEEGNAYRKKTALQAIEKMKNDLESLFDKTYLVSLGLTNEQADKCLTKFKDYLGPRKINEFIMYKYFWQGALLDLDMFDEISDYSFDFDTLFELYSTDNHDYGLESPYFDDVHCIDNEAHYIEQFKINESSLPEFENMDKLDLLITEIQRLKNNDKQDSYTHKRCLERFYKKFNTLV